MLVTARTSTEKTLQAHSRVLLQSLDVSMEQSRTLHASLEQQTVVQRDHFNAAEEYCTEALAVFQRLREHSDTVCATQQQQRTEVVEFFAQDAHEEGVAMLRSLKGSVDALTLLVSEVANTLGEDLAAAKDVSTEATEAMVTGDVRGI